MLLFPLKRGLKNRGRITVILYDLEPKDAVLGTAMWKTVVVRACTLKHGKSQSPEKRPYHGNTSISRVRVGSGRSSLQFSSWSSSFVHIIVNDWLRRSVGVNKEFSRRQKSWLPAPALTYTLTFYLQPALDKRHQQILGPWDLACSRASCIH